MSEKFRLYAVKMKLKNKITQTVKEIKKKCVASVASRCYGT